MNLTLFTGPMESGKSAKLIEAANTFNTGRESGIFAVSNNKIESRNGQSLEAITLSPGTSAFWEAKFCGVATNETPDKNKTPLKNVFVDECQFMTPEDAMWVVNFFRKTQANLWIAGLDLQANGKAYASTMIFAAYANQVFKVKGYCKKSKQLRYSLEIDPTKPRESKERYCGVCEDCYFGNKRCGE